MTVRCDRCQKEFPNLLKEKTKQIGGTTIIHTFLQCPKCGEVYTVCYNSNSTLTLAKQIRKRTAELRNIKDEKQYGKKLKEINKKQKRLEKEMKILQTKYQEYFRKEQ